MMYNRQVVSDDCSVQGKGNGGGKMIVHTLAGVNANKFYEYKVAASGTCLAGGTGRGNDGHLKWKSREKVVIKW